MKNKRLVDIAVLSDIHLGTYGSHASELLDYLKSIKPKKLVLNGDIIDMWQFNKRYFPAAHTAVIRQVIKMVEQGVKVYYITGNHDDALRHYSPFASKHFELIDKLVLTVDGKRYWIFHGDVFDSSIQHAKWIAKLGGYGYDLLIRGNRLINKALHSVGKQPVSLSKKIKANIKNAVRYINDFEDTAIELAIDQGYDYVICGHIHQPCIRSIKSRHGSTTYMNSGDWVENLTALEYVGRKWSIYYHRQKDLHKPSSAVSTVSHRTIANRLLRMPVNHHIAKAKS